MVKNRVNLTGILVIITALGLSCDAWVTLKGKVIDENGRSIYAAKIIVRQGTSKIIEKTTERDGSFHIYESITPGPLASSIIKVTVEKEGYQAFESEFDWTKDQGRFRDGSLVITLKQSL
ncbi:MAG: carboxypeptidase-like regulatory domain-containing protein [Pyrinomonadaceae bacterium]